MKYSAPTSFVLIAFATFFMCMVPNVQAKTCSNATAAGTWGFTTSGVFFFPPNPFSAPIVNVGIFTNDREGNFVGSQTRNVAGMLADETIKGTFTVNSDCTGTIVANAFDPISGSLIGTSTLSVVLFDDARKLRALFTKSVDPQGNPLLGVLSADGERVLAKDEGEGDGCTLTTLKGSWAFTNNGTVVGVGPLAGLGVIHFDGEGHSASDSTGDFHVAPFRVVIDGKVFSGQTTGTYIVNHNCTGTTMDNLGNSSAFVIVGARKEEIIGISTLPAQVAIVRATRLRPRD